MNWRVNAQLAKRIRMASRVGPHFRPVPHDATADFEATLLGFRPKLAHLRNVLRRFGAMVNRDGSTLCDGRSRATWALGGKLKVALDGAEYNETIRNHLLSAKNPRGTTQPRTGSSSCSTLYS